MDVALHQLRTLHDWSSMLLVIGMTLFVLGSGLATVIIRHWGKRPKTFKVRIVDPRALSLARWVWRKACDWVSKDEAGTEMEPWGAARLGGTEPLTRPTERRGLHLAQPQPGPWTEHDEKAFNDMVRNTPAPAADHRHCIDLERSRLTMLDSGEILAQCCVAGCTVVITLGRNIAYAVIEEERVK